MMVSGAPQPPGDAAPTDTLLQRALNIQSFRQGQLDGLCGLYVAINAIRLLRSADRALSPIEAKALYVTGVRMLAKREKLASAVLNGVPDKIWCKLVTKLAGELPAGAGQAIDVERPFRGRPRVSRRELLTLIEAAVDASQPVLLSLSGKHAHYTIVCGYTARRFVLFDSSSLSWLSRDLCGPSHSRRDWGHTINTGSLMVMRWSGAQSARANS